MKIKMKNVRKKMLARDLKGIIDLPNYADDQLVQVTVYPTEEEKKLTPEEHDKIWKNIQTALAGADKSKTLDDWRNERLEEKYGIKFAN